jgi:succinate dehydrogenase/fumarate reductase cytochrome b subunit
MVQPIQRQLDLPTIPNSDVRLHSMSLDPWLASSSARTAPERAPVIAALAALAYPGLLWCGIRLSPAFVVLALAVPLLGLIAAARPAVQRAPAARNIAHLVVAAPPLFSLLGGWLDFQHAVPIHSLGVWLPLWSALAVAAAWSRPALSPQAAPGGSPGGRLAIAHGVSAAAIALFALPHLVNHLGGLLGGETHIAIMAALRRVYRHHLVEPVLLAAVAFQVGSGLWLLRRKLARSSANGWIDTLQTTSGAYLLMFLLSHVTAALRARLLRGTDTNWHWLSGGELLTDPWSIRLVPYYFLAVVALGVHGGCGLGNVLRGHGASVRSGALLAVAAGIAAAASALIMIGLFRA